MKLGRLPADPAALARAPQLAGHMRAGAPPPPSLVRSHVPFKPQMFGNDILGDCSAAGFANYAEAVESLNVGGSLGISTPEAIGFYADSCGYVPGNQDTDGGGVLLDVLSHQLTSGFRRTDRTPLVADFATFDPKDRTTLARVMALYGAVYLGVDLADSDLDNDASDPSVPFDLRARGNQTPKPENGHLLLAFDYAGLKDTDMVTLATWGIKKPAPWAWVLSRAVEAYALIFRGLQRADGKNFAGLTYDDQRAGMSFTA